MTSQDEPSAGSTASSNPSRYASSVATGVRNSCARSASICARVRSVRSNRPAMSANARSSRAKSSSDPDVVALNVYRPWATSSAAATSRLTGAVIRRTSSHDATVAAVRANAAPAESAVATVSANACSTCDRTVGLSTPAAERWIRNNGVATIEATTVKMTAPTSKTSNWATSSRPCKPRGLTPSPSRSRRRARFE